MDLSPDEQRIYDELAERARRLERGDYALDTPPADVWDVIEAELAGDRAPLTVDRRRGRPGRWLLAAAAAVVVLALGAWLLTTPADDAGTVVASAPLDSLDENPANLGQAELIDVDGRLRLKVDTEELEAGEDDFLEVWVIDPDVTELISLGPVRADGTYDLPPSVDPERFPIVDISREPVNGDPTHSGDSLVRGQLDFA